MADTRPRSWEADQSSRSRDSKTPRLELDGNDEDWCCDHVPTDSAQKEILSWSLLSDDAGTCKDCRREEGCGGRPKHRRILVCLECGRHSCGDSTSYLPFGHALGITPSRSSTGSPRCSTIRRLGSASGASSNGLCIQTEPDDDEVEIIGEIQAGHAFGFDMPRDLVNLGDAWRAAELGSANAQGYAMPNRGNTCYLSAMVQCLLALDKLRARMLGPESDPPPGHLGMALRELFVEATSADSAGGMLDPDKLLRIVRLHAGKYEAYKMHDSFELLESLRNALHEEENGIENPYRKRGAPTVVDSIFRGELSETRSCVYCQSASAFHGHFWDLSLSLLSEEDLFISVASSSSSPSASKSLKYCQPKKAATHLLSANESNLGKIDAKSGDSHLLGSELNGLVVVKTSGPMEIGSAEEQHTWQIQDVIQDPLYNEETLHSVGFVPHSSSGTNVEQKIQMTTDFYCCLEDMDPPPLVAPLSEHDAWTMSGRYVDHNDKGIGEINCIPTIEDCLSLFFKQEVVEWSCDCSMLPMEPSTNQIRKGKLMEVCSSDGSNTEQSDMATCPNEQSSELNSFLVECRSSCSRQQDGSDAESEIIQMVDTTIGANSRMTCGHEETKCHDGIQEVACRFLLTEKQTNLSSTQHSPNLILPNQGLRKRVGVNV